MEIPGTAIVEEVDRAVGEVRRSLGRLAQREKLSAPLLSVCTLVDRITIGVTEEAGDSAFVLDEQKKLMLFRAAPLRMVMREGASLAARVGDMSTEEAARIGQAAINMFVLHELMHVQQNFPHFATVALLKAGVPSVGLPMLDVAADVIAAWICAQIEIEQLNLSIDTDFLPTYANFLILSYLIGVYVFSVAGRAPKMQRALGILISAVLVQAKHMGILNPDGIYSNWDPISPLMAFDFEASQSFNAIVIDRVPGLLLSTSDQVPEHLVNEIWGGVGKASPSHLMAKIAKALEFQNVIDFSRFSDRAWPARAGAGRSA